MSRLPEMQMGATEMKKLIPVVMMVLVAEIALASGMLIPKDASVPPGMNTRPRSTLSPPKSRKRLCALIAMNVA